MAAPTGFVALAPLVAATPVVWRCSARGPAAGGRWPAGGWWCSPPPRSGACSGSATAPTATSSAPRRSSRRSSGPDLVPGDHPLRGAPRHRVHFGSYARRAAVLVCLLALVWFLVLLVAARARDLVVPCRLPLAGWTDAPRVRPAAAHAQQADPPLRRPRRARGGVPRPAARRRSPSPGRRARPGAAGPAGRAGRRGALGGARARPRRARPGHVAVRAGASGMPAYGDYPSVRGHGVRPAALVGARARRRSRARWRSPPPLGADLRRLALAGGRARAGRRLARWGSPSWTVGDFTRAAVRTSATWSPQVDAWTDPARHAVRAGPADRRPGPRGRPGPARGLPGGPSAPLPVDAGRAPPEQRTEPFVPGAVFPDQPAPSGTGARRTPVWGSFLVPEDGRERRRPRRHVRHGLVPAPPGVADAGDGRGRVRPDSAATSRCARSTARGRCGVRRRSGSRPVGDAGGVVDVADRATASTRTPRRRVRTSCGSSRTTTAPPPAAGWRSPPRPSAAGYPCREYLPADARGRGRLADQVALPRASASPARQSGITEPASAAIAYGDDARRTRWRTGPSTPSGAACWVTPSARPTSPCSPRASAAPATRSTTCDVLDFRQPYPTDGYELIRRRETVSGLP